MLVTEPMVACMAVYASFVYGLLFFQLESFPIVFEQERGWGLIDSTLPFLVFSPVLCSPSSSTLQISRSTPEP
jgi:hypothetical protein